MQAVLPFIALLVLAGVLSGAARADDNFLNDQFCDREFREFRMSGYIRHVRDTGRIFHFDGRHRRKLYRVILVDEIQWYADVNKTNLIRLVKCQFEWDPV